MNISKNILKLRRKLGMSQIKFAFELGISQQSICHYEVNRRQPSIEIACKMIKLAKKNDIQMTLEELLCC